jgi:hypothetical protein
VLKVFAPVQAYNLRDARQSNRAEAGTTQTLLRGMYGLVDGREGFTATPMRYFALGIQIGLQQDVTDQTIRFLVSEGLLDDNLSGNAETEA